MAMFDLLPETTGFKLENALALAHAAELAYEDEARIRETVLDQWGCGHFHFFDRKGTQAFAMANERVVIVAFRGTERKNYLDWITNLQLDLTKGPLGGRVHAGFHKGLNAVWKDIDRVVKELRANHTRSLWFTGHSLGAALATLAVARLVELDQPVYGLYTFGSPRVGDRKFSRNFNFEYRPRMFRFVNNNDTVTRIPPRSDGYSHVGTFRYFTHQGDLVDDMGWWYQFLDRVGGRMDDFRQWGTDGLKDHAMTEYRRLLEKAASSRPA
ncbi:MAG: lipase family protein [Pirellulaceae bacterium]|nr:lipase family protein [Pirellulaceae bacterium]